jgi:Kelch motif
MGVVTFLTDMGLFIGRSQAFVDYMTGLAADADAGARQCCAATDFSIFPPEQGVSVRWALCWEDTKRRFSMTRRKSHQFAKNLVRVSISMATLGLVASAAIPVFASGTFQNTGSLNVARIDHTATLLANGEVLVAGGDNNTTGYLSSAEVYNHSTGKWTHTDSMTVPREGHGARHCYRMARCWLPEALMPPLTVAGL